MRGDIAETGGGVGGAGWAGRPAGPLGPRGRGAERGAPPAMVSGDRRGRKRDTVAPVCGQRCRSGSARACWGSAHAMGALRTPKARPLGGYCTCLGAAAQPVADLRGRAARSPERPRRLAALCGQQSRWPATAVATGVVGGLGARGRGTAAMPVVGGPKRHSRCQWGREREKLAAVGNGAGCDRVAQRRL